MATVEEDLERSKLAREKQKDEYKKHTEERRRKHETEVILYPTLNAYPLQVIRV